MDFSDSDAREEARKTSARITGIQWRLYRKQNKTPPPTHNPPHFNTIGFTFATATVYNEYKYLNLTL